ncbi:MAG: bile acid:sodium symporter, partial [Pseudomonadota bacterium]|nr:bile acid:sodium symporter [Pseudomonadota bacterium]
MQILVEIFIPLLIILMMLVVGLELTTDDFRRVRQFPTIVIAASAGQLLLLPTIGIAVAWALEPTSTIVAGMILVIACPGGAISNYYVYMGRANVVLSVTLTAVSTILSIITLPIIAAAGFWLLLKEGEHIDVPVALMIGQLFFLLLLPIATGMWVRRLWPQWVARQASSLRRFSIMALALIILFVIWEQTDNLVSHFKELALSASIYTLLTMLAGWGVGAALKANPADRFTLMVEFSVRNLGIVTVVGATLLGNTELVV